LFEHDLSGKPVPTHRVVARGMLFQIMLCQIAKIQTATIVASVATPEMVQPAA
jgi:hypothetical protein